MADFNVAAQALAMEQMLKDIYDDFLPLVQGFITLGQAVGGLGALIFISSRVWGHIARAEAIDVYPLLRPFLIGLVIAFFPQMLGALRGITGSLATATDSVVLDRNKQIVALQVQKQNKLKAIEKNMIFENDDAFNAELSKLSWDDFSGKSGLYFDRMGYKTKKEFREWMRNALELFHVAARLLISVVATFLLIVLSVVGPLTFGLAIFPAFGESIPKWFGNFITISLWVPVANIFGAIMGQIQVRMLQADIAALNTPGIQLDSADFGYLCFLCMAIVGYFFIPLATNLLISASGMGQASQSIVSSISTAIVNPVAAVAGGATGAAGRGAGAAASAAGQAGASAAGSVGRYGLGTLSNVVSRWRNPSNPS